MNLNCIIVDDEPVARKVLEEYIGDIDFLTLVGKAENPVKANALLEEHKIDLLFLDINMPLMNGIDFIKSSPELPLTVLTTAYPDYALQGFELDVLDYLVKPFSAERFLKACTKAKEYYLIKNKLPEEQRSNYFFVKCDGRIEKVFYDEVIYVEAMQNYVMLHTENRKMLVYLTIKAVEEQLPSNLFLKIHKSTIIHVGKIKSIQGNEVDLGSAKVIISQGLYENVMNEIVRDKLMKR